MENKELKLNIQLTEKDYMDFQWSHFSFFQNQKMDSIHAIFNNTIWHPLHALHFRSRFFRNKNFHILATPYFSRSNYRCISSSHIQNKSCF